MSSSSRWSQSCSAQKLLDKLFRENKIDDIVQPHVIRSQYPEFLEYPTETFRIHFTKTKDRFGKSVVATGKESKNKSKDSKKRKQDHDDNYGDEDDDIQEEVNYQDKSFALGNWPHTMSIFTDPLTGSRKVTATFYVPTGSSGHKIELSSDGTMVYLSFGWPKSIATARGMFKSYTDEGTPVCHPMLMAYDEALSNLKASIDDIPRGNVSAHLPLVVQTDTSSWSYGGLELEDGAKVIIAFFKPIQTSYEIKAEVKAVEFKKTKKE